MTWWIALTQPCCERRATARLVERGFDPWYPTREVEIVNRFTKQMKRKPTRSYPAFPGYLFVRTGRSHHELRDVDDIRGVLCNDWHPLTVSDAEVERVRSHAADMLPVEEWQPYTGQPVRVIDGPLAGHAGPIEYIRGQAAAVLFDILGRPTPVLVPVKDLRAAA